MPKLKTHKGLKKRFSITKTGKVKRSHAGRRHLFSNKSGKQRRQARKATYVVGRQAETYRNSLDI